jgi:hypothetical protein
VKKLVSKFAFQVHNLRRYAAAHANMERRAGQPGKSKAVFEDAMAVERSKESASSKVGLHTLNAVECS